MSSLPDPDTLIESLADELAGLAAEEDGSSPIMVGIRTGGFWVAERLAHRLELSEPVSALDIGFHRDDYDARGLPNQIQPSHIESVLEDRLVVLVDDVLHSGRTVRAAINALFEYGRPRRIVLAVLLDRGGRDLPIQPDFTGASIEMPATQRIKLSGPDPLGWQLRETDDG